jgi:glycosyltransferase involved in cell wall biosynthesis
MKAFKLYSSQAGKAASILRIVGLPRGETSFRNLARDLGIAGLVAFEPYLPEQDLQALYRRAKALLIPSLMEGFGIPALEAMASGTPVIASNTTSLPEVCGRAAIYFDPMDIDQMAAAVTSVMAKEDLRREMSADGLRQAEIFHPNVIGQQVEKFWAGVASTTKPTGNR